jgi:hypothetical protein
MKFSIILFFTFLMFQLHSQTPDQIVQQQLEAYNKHDIDSFMMVFHQEIELCTLGSDTVNAVGWENVKDLYADLFIKSPKLHSKVLTRSVIGNKVIDYERISGRKGASEDVFLVMIYEIKDGLIWKAWAVRE